MKNLAIKLKKRFSHNGIDRANTGSLSASSRSASSHSQSTQQSELSDSSVSYQSHTRNPTNNTLGAATKPTITPRIIGVKALS